MTTHVLTVASYNIRKARGLDGRDDLVRIARVIGELGADVVGLQEVFAVQARRLAAELRMDLVMGVVREGRHGPYGNAAAAAVLRFVDLANLVAAPMQFIRFLRRETVRSLAGVEAALDPVEKIPEYKVCAVGLEAAGADRWPAVTLGISRRASMRFCPQRWPDERMFEGSRG